MCVPPNMCICMCLGHEGQQDMGQTCFLGLNQGMAHYDPNVANCFVNFYWKPAMFLHLHGIYGFICATVAELNNCDRDRMAHSAKIFPISSLQETFAHYWTTDSIT